MANCSRLVVGLVATALAWPAAVAGASSPGGFEQLAGASGCVSRTGSHGRCERARLDDRYANAVAVSPDGRNVYVAGNPVAVFARNPRTDRLRQLAGRAGVVTPGGGSPIVSPDGHNVYLISRDRVLVFARGADGRLSRLPGSLGCVSESGAMGCSAARGLTSVDAATIMRDGRSVLVLGAGTVAVFARDPATGALEQLAGTAGCVGHSATDGCATERGLTSTNAIAASPDGRSVYVGAVGGNPDGSASLAVFSRDPETGALTQLAGASGCLNRIASEGCATFTAIASFHSLAVSPDGRTVYAGGDGFPSSSYIVPHRLVALARDPDTGSLAALPGGAGGCIEDIGSLHEPCALWRAQPNRPLISGSINDIAFSPDGEQIYTAQGVGSAYRTEEGPPGRVMVLARDPASGAFHEQAGVNGCVGDGDNRYDDCRPSSLVAGDLKLGGGAAGLAVSPDGEAIYVAASRAIVVLVRPIAEISGRSTRVGRAGIVPVAVSCLTASGRCSGTLALTSAHRVKLTRHRPRTLALGHRPFSIASGTTAIVRVRLPALALGELRRARIASLAIRAIAQTWILR